MSEWTAYARSRGVDPVRQEERVGEDVALAVGPLRGVLNRVGREVVQQVVDGLIERPLNAGATERIDDVARRVDAPPEVVEDALIQLADQGVVESENGRWNLSKATKNAQSSA